MSLLRRMWSRAMDRRAPVIDTQRADVTRYRLPSAMTPQYAATVRATGVRPDRPPFDQDREGTRRAELAALARPLELEVDDLLTEADMLALTIATGTLVGRREVA